MELKFSNIFKGDKVLWNAIFVLSIISIAAVYSATGALAYQDGSGGNTLFYLIKHSIFLSGGFFLVIIIQYIDYNRYAKYIEVILIFSFALSFITLFAGVEINGARRWLNIPGINYLFQPSELAKFAVMIYSAKVLAGVQKSEAEMKAGIKKILVVVAGFMAVTVLADLSSAALIFITAMVLMFAARVKVMHIFMILGVTIVLGFTVITIGSAEREVTWQNRITDFYSGKGASQQPENAKAAIATGGFFGKGPGNSEARNVLPQTYSDFIYAFIIEEYGFLGGSILVGVYLWIFIRGITIVQGIKKIFPALLSLGLILSLTIQAFLNMSVSVGLAPVTGQTLPFVSMGGTSLVFTALTFGIILNISRMSQLDSNTEQKVQRKKVATEEEKAEIIEE